jgi:hypothetical protein
MLLWSDKLLLALVSTLILVSESRENCEHMLLYQNSRSVICHFIRLICPNFRISIIFALNPTILCQLIMFLWSEELKIVTFLGLSDYRRGMYWILDLLTSCIHRSEVQVITDHWHTQISVHTSRFLTTSTEWDSSASVVMPLSAD